MFVFWKLFVCCVLGFLFFLSFSLFFLSFFFFLWCSGSNPRPWNCSHKHAAGSIVDALFCASPLILEAVSLSDWGGSGTHCRVQMALNLGSSCLCLLSDGIAGMRHHIWLPLCSLAHFKTGFFASRGLVFQFFIFAACQFLVRSTIGKYFLILDRLSLNPADCFPGYGRAPYLSNIWLPEFKGPKCFLLCVLGAIS